MVDQQRFARAVLVIVISAWILAWIFCPYIAYAAPFLLLKVGLSKVTAGAAAVVVGWTSFIWFPLIAVLSFNRLRNETRSG
jgi:hypothetical protein